MPHRRGGLGCNTQPWNGTHSCNSCWTPGLPGGREIHWLQTFPNTHVPFSSNMSYFYLSLSRENRSSPMCPASPAPFPRHSSACPGWHEASVLGWQLQSSVSKNHPSKINLLYTLLCRFGSGRCPESGRNSPMCLTYRARSPTHCCSSTLALIYPTAMPSPGSSLLLFPQIHPQYIVHKY